MTLSKLALLALMLVGQTAPPTAEPALPFERQPLRLDEVLKTCLAKNPQLAENAIDIAVSETTVLAAMGQFDPQLEASVGLGYNEQTPRGSTIVFSSGGSRRSFSVGLAQQVKTGGRYQLKIDVLRTRTDQLNFFDPQAGPSEIKEYVVAPTLVLSHPLLRGMGVKVNTARIKKNKLARNQAQARAQEIVQNKVRDVLYAYWDLAFAQGELKHKEQAKAHAQKLLEKTRAEVESGRVAPVQIKAVKQRLATHEQAVLNASVQILDKSLALRELMADPMDPKAPLGIIAQTTIALDAQPLPPLAQVVKETMKHHPQLRALELALATRRIDELKAINDKLPTLDLSLTLSSRGRSVDSLDNPQTGATAQAGSWKQAFANFFNESPKDQGLLADYSVDASLTFAWDIRNRVAKSQAQSAHQEILRAKLSLASLGKTLRAQAIRNHIQQKVARKSVEVATMAVELAQVNLDAENARYDAGRSTNFDVLARIDEHADAERQLLQAKIEALKAKVQEQQLTGTLLDRYGIDLRASSAASQR